MNANKYLALLFSWLLLAGCTETTLEPTRYGTLTGTVLDARTSQPLASVVVTTNPATSSYLTDAKGQFSIRQVPTGAVSVTVHKADYTNQTTSINVVEGQAQNVALLLARPSATTPPTPPLSPAPPTALPVSPRSLLWPGIRCARPRATRCATRWCCMKATTSTSKTYLPTPATRACR